MREQFKTVDFHPATIGMIHLCNEIIDHLGSLGYRLTLRQLYYQLVQRNVIRNKQTEYKRLGEIINNARLCGLIDWDAIEDRTRALRGVNHFTDPAQITQTAASAFRLNKWNTQPIRCEVWVEKDALVGVLEKACQPLDVDYFSCRGYTSQSEVYGAAKRLMSYVLDEQKIVIIHLGDHDPSGIDMTRDIMDRITMFSEGSFTGTRILPGDIEIQRIALNMDQVTQYHPPPNPAKSTDSRFEGYEAKFGKDSWELDALDVQVIDKLITETVLRFRDEDLWDEEVEKENHHRDMLQKCATRWREVEKMLSKPPKKPRKKKG